MLISYRANALPAVGSIVPTLHGQDYELARIQPHTNLSGQPSAILHWRTGCEDCGQDYAFTTGLTFDAEKRPRRCEACLKARFHGAEGEDRAAAARHRYGEAQRKSFADAKAVRAGTLALAPKSLVSIRLNDSCDALNCEFSFNDRKKRHATFKAGAVKCSAARGCDFSRFVPTLEKLLKHEVEKVLF